MRNFLKDDLKVFENQTQDDRIWVKRESIVSVLDMVYIHRKTSDGGDIYLTQFGLPLAKQLLIDNWFEKEWFKTNRVPLQGTGTVYRVPTKRIDGQSIELVIKNCRVGEHVPFDTHTLMEFINAEFNSPWEEFSLVKEIRDGNYGPAELQIRTQEPLAIYVPPEKMQLWQSGRSSDKINRIKARHPGIDLDILRQYKMIYGWINGKNIVEVFLEIGVTGDQLETQLKTLTTKVTSDLDRKGFAVADMKAAHIIIDEKHVCTIEEIMKSPGVEVSSKQIEYVTDLITQGEYSIVDYELLLRTPQHEEEVKHLRRHFYLDAQRDRFIPTQIPSHLEMIEILGVPYVHGQVESTGGQLWVAGRNSQLFDYFLPERWRKTASYRLSENNDEYYTVTKDNVHIIWKTSRVGERPHFGISEEHRKGALEVGFNSPFEEFAIAQFLSENGVPTVYMRAIYSTGTNKLEESVDLRRYESHRHIVGTDGQPVLQQSHNYILIRGYYNGPDNWVAQQTGDLCRRVDLVDAVSNYIITGEEYRFLLANVQKRLRAVGFDGSLLEGHDVLLTIAPDGQLVRNRVGEIEARICNFELISKIKG